MVERLRLSGLTGTFVGARGGEVPRSGRTRSSGMATLGFRGARLVFVCGVSGCWLGAAVREPRWL